MDDTPLPVTLPDIGRGRDKAPPKSFLAALSVIIGVLLAIGTIIGVMGKAFYVQRDEYTAKTLHDAEQDTATQQTLLRLGNALDRQEAAFNRLSETVQGIQIVIGGLRPAGRSR
jgi:hypothetical protein